MSHKPTVNTSSQSRSRWGAVPHWVTEVYFPLAIGAGILGLVFRVLAPSNPIGIRHLIAILLGGIVLPPVLIFGERYLYRLVTVFEYLGQWLGGRVRMWALLLFLAAFGLYTVLGLATTKWQPILHDEFSYRFGAETLAMGRLYNSPHPHREFFDAMHIWHEGKWVTRYPPGHPLALVPGVLIGWGGLAPVVLCAGTVVWTYWLAHDRLGPTGAAVAGILVLQSPGLLFVSGGLLSQSTFWFGMAGFYVCLFRSESRRQLGWGLAAGVLAGWALLTRPFPAVAMGWPAAVWLIAQLVGREHQVPTDAVDQDFGDGRIRAFHVGLFVAVAGPFLICVLLFLGYNWAITGSAFYSPWQQYRDIYEPANTLGFSTGGMPLLSDPSRMHWRKFQKAQAMAEDKQEFTPREALRRALLDPKRARDTIFPATCFLGLAMLWPFASRGRRWSSADTVLLVAVVSHYVAYSFFHAARDVGYYGLEVTPLLVYFTAAGAVGLWRKCRALNRPTLGLMAAVLVFLAMANHLLVQGPGFIRERREATACQVRFHERLAQRPHPEAPALVFVRYKRDHPFDRCDWINNSPSLDDPVLVVLDLGPRNEELINDFPERRALLYDEASDSLTELAPESARAPGPFRPIEDAKGAAPAP